jgi:uncharacterized membrane protein
MLIGDGLAVSRAWTLGRQRKSGRQLRIRTNDGLWLLILAIVAFPGSPIRVVLGIPFVLFFPGYALITALVPRKTGMSGIERVALSFGLSIALVILICLALNYTPFGIRLMPIVISLAAALLVLSAISWARERKIPEAERYSISFRPSLGSVWSGRPLDKALSVVLAVAILASLGAVAYTIAKPKPGEEFTEFYILGPGGKAEGYPSEVRIGEEASVTGGITNHFRTRVSYRIAVTVAGTPVTEFGPIELEPKGKWEGQVSFVPTTAGAAQKVEFLLYQTPAADNTTRSLHVWVDVLP